MKKILITIIAFVVFFISGISMVNAFSDKIQINTQGSGLTLNSEKQVTTASEAGNYAYFHIKNSNVGQVFCTSGKITPPSSGDECSKTTFDDDNQKKGVAYLINLIQNTNGDDNEKYWWSEFLINSYLGKYSYASDTDSFTYKYIISDSEYKILNTNMNYSQIMNEAANKTSATYKDVNLSVSSSSISFTKKEGYYESNAVKISTNADYNISLNNSKFNYICNDSNECIFKINESDISSGTTENLTVTISSKESPQTYYIAQNYNCGNGKQNVTPKTTQSVITTVASPVTLTGSVSAPALGKLIINKVDENNNPVIGATILVTSRTDDNFKKTFVTDGNPIVLDNLLLGKYSIDEEVVPAGYLKSEGKIVVLSEDNLTETVNLVDKFIKVSILKIDENNKPLSGVKLKLLNKDSKTLDICKDSLGNKISCEWTTTTSSYDIYNLPAGIYYIKEVSVPKGYDINPNKIKVEISATGEVKVDGKKVDNALIKILNNLTRTEITKISAVNGKELPGATLQILNEDEKVISCTIINKEGKKETLKECKWVSGEKTTTVLGLPSGTYFLEETIAPEGYELNKNKVEFKIKADGTITEVEMKNELVVKVPDTLSARSALLIAISMFDIALGIGIITYVRKNKVEE